MPTTAAFSGIQQHLEKSIAESTATIQLAVAWFTNKELLGLLTDKAAKGVTIEVITSDDGINQRLPVRDFLRAGGQRTVCLSKDSRFLHEKFAVFDAKKVVVGSYNWTYAAERHNHESVILSDEPLLVQQYQARFQRLASFAVPVSAATWFPATSSEVAVEDDLQQLEQDLQQDFLHTLAEAERLRIGMQYDFIRQYLARYGAIGAAKRLLATGTDHVQAGFRKLCEANRSDLTFESIISQDKYQRLFPDPVREQARKRLRG